MRARRSSIRFKILLPLLVPLVSLTALWLFAAGTTLGDGLDLQHVQTISQNFGYPSGSLSSALQQERRLSLTYLAGKAPDQAASLDSQRIRTDQQSEVFHQLTGDPDARSVASGATLTRTDDARRQLKSLPKLRALISSGKIDRSRAYSMYTDMISTLDAVQSSQTTLADPDVARESKSIVALTQARESLAEEDSLVSGALAAGRMSTAEHTRITQLVGAHERMYDAAATDLSGPDRAYYDHITGTVVYHRLRMLENRLMMHTRPGQKIHMDPVVWKITSDAVQTKMRGLELSANARADALSAPVAQGILWRIIGAGVVGLIALIGSIWLSVRAAASVVRELRGLRDSALALANQQLPSLIDRLRRNDDVDTTAEAPPLSFGTQEIDDVGEAFNNARRTAIDSAVGEARLRRGVSEIFVNLARRSQTLIHRQLTLLDTMENRVTDPEELEDLFRIDHLSTRMRRHAEGLIILSGSAPGRGWRNPVPVIDVVRGAASEVEDYARVKVQSMPAVSLAGAAVADVIHLLAELIENATQFSPPHTPVRVVGQTVGTGFVVEIEDRGLSMNAETLEAANKMLADPPPFDVISSARLGHFVVGRLATRHDIRVSLRTSPYGGTTAIVLLPSSLIVDGPQPAMDADTAAFDADLVAVSAGELPNAEEVRNSIADPPRPMHRPSEPSAPEPARQDASQDTEFRGNWDAMVSVDSSSVSDPITAPDPTGPSDPFGSSDPFASDPFPSPESFSSSASTAPPQPAMPPPPPLSEVSGAGGGPEPSASVRPSGRMGDGRPMLPQRVPQTNITPELRDPTATTDDVAQESAERSPDQVRSVLSSIQQGWQRGRSEAGTNGAAGYPSIEEEDN